MKLVGVVSNEIEIEQLRSDLHKLYNSETGQLIGK